MSSNGFVNHGLKRWERMREEWVTPPPGQSSRPKKEIKAKEIELEDVITRIFESGYGGQLPQPLALGQMVDILTDFWEADGLYD
jgi:hypothetical protein